MTEFTNAKVKFFPDYEIEKSYKKLLVAGIDEAGRGPVAGPVVAACVLLDEDFLRNKICAKINDSKKLHQMKPKRKKKMKLKM